MMIEFPSISIVIPAYNRSNTIRYCLDSVLNQTSRALEIIVVDDCSTDDTVDIVSSYLDSHVRCIVLEKNTGAQAARNRGIREAQGEWIAFQDSDDEWLPEKLEKQVQALALCGFDPWTVVHTNAVWLETASGKQLPMQLPEVAGADVFGQLLSRPGPLFPTLLVSKLALEAIGYLDEKVPSYQEWDTAIRLAERCRFIYLAEPLFVYHLHEGETISKDRKREISGYQYIIDKFADQIGAHCGAEGLDRHLIDNALKAMRFGLYPDALAILEKSATVSAKMALLKTMARCRANMAFFDFLIKVRHRKCGMSKPKKGAI